MKMLDIPFISVVVDNSILKSWLHGTGLSFRSGIGGSTDRPDL
jgi:hypothetical protein